MNLSLPHEDMDLYLLSSLIDPQCLAQSVLDEYLFNGINGHEWMTRENKYWKKCRTCQYKAWLLHFLLAKACSLACLPIGSVSWVPAICIRIWFAPDIHSSDECPLSGITAMWPSSTAHNMRSSLQFSKPRFLMRDSWVPWGLQCGMGSQSLSVESFEVCPWIERLD